MTRIDDRLPIEPPTPPFVSAGFVKAVAVAAIVIGVAFALLMRYHGDTH